MGPAGQNSATTLQADGGGTLTASALTSIGGADVVVEASGGGSLVSLPALTTITADTTHANSLTQVQAIIGGDIELPALTQVNGGPVLFRSNGAGGKLDIAALSSLVGPAGQNSATTLEADGGGSLLPPTSAVLAGRPSRLQASGTGSLLSLPKLTAITVSAGTSDGRSSPVGRGRGDSPRDSTHGVGPANV